MTPRELPGAAPPAMPRSGGAPTTRKPPAPKGRLRAFALALVMHGLLALMLFVGIRWQTREPAPVAAELWTPATPAEPRPAPAPLPKPAPDPAPRPPQPAPPPEPAPPVQKPDIVLEQERKAREEAARKEAAQKEAERREAERREEEGRRQAELRRREAAERAAREKVAQEKAAQERAAQEKAAREKAAQEKAAQEKALAARREAEAKAKREAEEEARAEAQEKARQDYVDRLRAAAGAPGPTAGGPSGAAGAAGGGTDSGYVARLSGLIRSNTVYQAPPDLAGNPKAVFLVKVAPDCAILSVKLRRSSGIAAWDEAAERGIQRSSPLPRQRDGSCPPEIEIARGPKDDR